MTVDILLLKEIISLKKLLSDISSCWESDRGLFPLAAESIDKIKVYCCRTPCVFRTAHKALFMSSHIVHFQRIMICLCRWISHLRRPLQRPSVSISESRRCTIDCDTRESSSPANAARFYAMPSVTIIVELSHTLDLMDSRRLLTA